jgi:hypothetical protein
MTTATTTMEWTKRDFRAVTTTIHLKKNDLAWLVLDEDNVVHNSFEKNGQHMLQ